jgi:hypothetical protein
LGLSVEFCATRKTPEAIAALRQLLNPLRNGTSGSPEVNVIQAWSLRLRKLQNVSAARFHTGMK